MCAVFVDRKFRSLVTLAGLAPALNSAEAGWLRVSIIPNKKGSSTEMSHKEKALIVQIDVNAIRFPFHASPFPSSILPLAADRAREARARLQDDEDKAANLLL